MVGVVWTHIHGLEHALDLHTGDLGEPRGSQVTVDEKLQVDWLQDLDVWLLKVPLHCGSMSRSRG